MFADAGIRRQKGAVLFIVLAVMSALIFLAANFAINMSRSTGMLVNLTEGVQSRYSALSGIQYAMFAVQERERDLRWKLDGTINTIELGDAKIWVTVSSAANKIDINKASREQLTEVLKNIGVEEEDVAKELVTNILHWRGRVDNTGDDGSITDDDYEKAGLQAPAHRQFLIPEEVGSVIGVEGAIYAKLLPLITVYGSQRVDALTATDSVLFALGLKPEEITMLKRARQAFYADETPIPNDALFGNPYLEVSRRSVYYRVQSHALLYGETPATEYAVFSTRREKDGSFSIIESGSLFGEARALFLERVEWAQQQSRKP